MLVRRSTAGLHAALERAPALARLASNACSLDDYAAGVRLLADGFAAADRILCEGEHFRPSSIACYRPRAEQLYAELPDHEQTKRIPVSAAGQPAIRDNAAYLGVRYVVDGAQFGHRLIAHALLQSPARSVLQRRDSFWRTTFVTTADWRLLCQALSGLTQRRQAATAARWARWTFRQFRYCFAEAAMQQTS